MGSRPTLVDLAGDGGKGLVECLDVADAAPPAASQVAEIAAAEAREPVAKLTRQRHVLVCQRPDIGFAAFDQHQRRVERRRPPDPEIGMQEFLHHLGRGDERDPIAAAGGKEGSRRGAERMRTTDRVE